MDNPVQGRSVSAAAADRDAYGPVSGAFQLRTHQLRQVCCSFCGAVHPTGVKRDPGAGVDRHSREGRGDHGYVSAYGDGIQHFLYASGDGLCVGGQPDRTPDHSGLYFIQHFSRVPGNGVDPVLVPQQAPVQVPFHDDALRLCGSICL